MALKDWGRSLTINTTTTILITVTSGVLPPLGVLLASGRRFSTTAHLVPGWLILCASAAAGLFAASVGLNIGQLLVRRRAARRTLSIVAEGHPNALNWSIGEWAKPAKAPVMQPCGDFHITNLSSANITVPRTVLVAKHMLWGFIPWRRRVEGASSRNVINARYVTQERLIWFVERPFLKKGQTMQAKVGLVDNLGQVNWGEWSTWTYLG